MQRRVKGGAAAAAAAAASNRSQPRSSVERGALAALLVVAWAWIMVTFGMIFYHGYYKKSASTSLSSSNSFGSGDNNKNKLHMSWPGMLPLQALEAMAERKKAGLMKEIEKDLLKLRKVQAKAPSSSSAIVHELQSVLHPYESPLLIFTCHREQYLTETLQYIYQHLTAFHQHHNNGDDFFCRIGCPIVISQDGNDAKVAAVIQDFTRKFAAVNIPVVHLQHKSNLRGAAFGHDAYQALAAHYGWALQQVFDGQAKATTNAASTTATSAPQRVIILEEDIRIAVDFFEYFARMAVFLEKDRTLFAVSAFHDNGLKNRVLNTTRVVRNDFFPGLGWMMTARLWNTELSHKWPAAYWDDWLRESAQRHGRHVLRPEVSRTFHFGREGGASLNQFGSQLSQIKLNDDPVDWFQVDLSYLDDADRYDQDYLKRIQAAQEVHSVEDAMLKISQGDLRLHYAGFSNFQRFARALDLMEDEKAGVPRGAYKGVVETRLLVDDTTTSDPSQQHLLFLAPPMDDLQREFQAGARINR